MDFEVKITETPSEEAVFFRNRKYAIQDGCYGYYNRDDGYVKCGGAVYIEKIYTVVNTAEKQYILYFFDAQGRKITIPFYRKDLTEIGIVKLLANGVQVTKKSAVALINTIFNQEKDSPHEMIHSTLGFWEYNKRQVFLGEQGIGISSSFIKKLKIKPEGDFEVWKKMIREEVLGTPMEVILATAATAPLVDFLKNDIHTGNLLLSMVGESSTGKTCSGCLGVSCGAKPSFRGDSMITTFGDSKNSLMHSMYSSYPMLIDEGSLINYNPTVLMYSLAEGKEKARLTKELNKADAMVFSTTILMTSEKSILGLCDQNSGLLVRCLEFENVIWTKSAESADIIKQVCERNYGFVIPLIAERLIEIDEKDEREKLLNAYFDMQKTLVKKAKERKTYNALTERYMKIIALIVTGAKLFSDVLGIVLDIDMISDFLQEQSAVANGEMMDIGNRAMSYLCQYIALHSPKFVRGESNSNIIDEVPFECLGRLQYLKGAIILNNSEKANIELFISDLAFERIMYEGRFPDKKVVLKSWKEKGYLHSQKDRYLEKVKITSVPAVSGYRVYIPIKEETANFKELDGKELDYVKDIFSEKSSNYHEKQGKNENGEVI